MPLVVVAILFLILFACEAIDYASRRADEERALRRYHEIEYPTRPTSDHYLDWLG